MIGEGADEQVDGFDLGSPEIDMPSGLEQPEQTVTDHFQQMLDDGIVRKRPSIRLP